MNAETERNRLGQFATPLELAADILEYAKRLLPPDQRIRFFDPAFGKGAFYAALRRSFSPARVEKAWGYEVDPILGTEARDIWSGSPLVLRIEDFTKATFPRSENDKANLLICNPPYVRHHHISKEDKSRLQSAVNRITGLQLNGLTGLYCYFLLIAHRWMANGGLAGWLIPSEFMDVNYGHPVKEYLLQQVKLIHVHRFDPSELKFEDAIVSSTVVWFTKDRSPIGHKVGFGYGGSLLEPKMSEAVPVDVLRQTRKWTRVLGPSDGVQLMSTSRHINKSVKLSDLFEIKRGLATGANRFFILSPEQIEEHGIPSEYLVPLLPSPRYVPTDEISADIEGIPTLGKKVFLLDCNLREEDVQAKHPLLWEYLQTGIEQGINKRHLCSHRSPWYSQEKRPPALFLCTYMGSDKERPFRFILNHSKATATNVYLMLYPVPALKKKLEESSELTRGVWQALNEISIDTLKAAGRIYGGGLHKIEPGELASIPADGIVDILPEGVVG